MAGRWGLFTSFIHSFSLGTACGVRLLRARPNPGICGSHPHTLSLRFKKVAGRWGLLTSFVLSGPPSASTTLTLRERTPVSGFLHPPFPIQKNTLSGVSFGGKMGIRTPDRDKPYNRFRVCRIRPLCHLPIFTTLNLLSVLLTQSKQMLSVFLVYPIFLKKSI